MRKTSKQPLPGGQGTNQQQQQGDENAITSLMRDVELEGTRELPPAGSASHVSPSVSPTSPESEVQSGMVNIAEMSYLNDDPIPPPSPFDQPSTSRDFTIKVCYL